MIRVIGNSRIHITLIDLGGATSRAYGGAGFALSAYPTVIKAERSFNLRIVAAEGVSNDIIDACTEACGRLLDQHVTSGANLNILSHAPIHAGLGSKTTAVLSSILAVKEVNGLQVSDSDLKLLSNRGGASGVGVNSFFEGGFIVDDGHDQRSVADLLPSSLRSPTEIPRASIKMNFPSAWEVYLFFPNGETTFGVRESEFFRQNVPVPKIEILEVMSSIYHGLVPALAREDLSAFGDGLKQISAQGFKAREIKAQNTQVREILTMLEDVPDIACGMSSFGPTLYAICRIDDIYAQENLNAIAKNAQVEITGPFAGSRGYQFHV